MKTTLISTIALVLNEDYTVIGKAEFSREELDHFTSTGSAPAKVCLSAEDIARLGIDEDDYVYIRCL